MEKHTAQSLRLYCSDFIHHYYSLLKENSLQLNRFFGENSSFVFGDLANNIGDDEVCGSNQILEKLKQLNFVNCHVNIRKVDSHAVATNDKLIVVQVIGELSRSGESMRKFLQTFVLSYVQSSTLDYLIHNNIFRYLDEVFCITEVNKASFGNGETNQDVNNDEEVVLTDNKVSGRDLSNIVATKRKSSEETLVCCSKVAKVSETVTYPKNNLENVNNIAPADHHLKSVDGINIIREDVAANDESVDSNENACYVKKNLPTQRIVLPNSSSQTPVYASYKAEVGKVKYWRVVDISTPNKECVHMIHCPDPKCSSKVKLCNLSRHISNVHASLAVELHCPVCKIEVNIANVAKHRCFMNNQCATSKKKRIRSRSDLKLKKNPFRVLHGLSVYQDIVSSSEGLGLLMDFVRTKLDPIVRYELGQVVTECSVVYKSYQKEILKQGGTKVLSLTNFLLQVNYISTKYWNVDVGPFKKEEGKEEERVHVFGGMGVEESTNRANYFKVALK